MLALSFLARSLKSGVTLTTMAGPASAGQGNALFHGGYFFAMWQARDLPRSPTYTIGNVKSIPTTLPNLQCLGSKRARSTRSCSQCVIAITCSWREVTGSSARGFMRKGRSVYQIWTWWGRTSWCWRGAWALAWNNHNQRCMDISLNQDGMASFSLHKWPRLPKSGDQTV